VHPLTQVSVQSVRAKRAPGRPAKSTELTPVQGYRLQATLERTAIAEDTFSRQRSRFILATNQLDILNCSVLRPFPSIISNPYYWGQR